MRREPLEEIAPLLRRAVDLDAGSVVRLRSAGPTLHALTRLPFGVLVGRSVLAPDEAAFDLTWSGAGTLAWLDGTRADPPERADGAWRWAAPPLSGWTRVETVPDTEVRPLVRAAALTLKQAAERDGHPGAQPRAQTADAVLDAVALTVHGPGSDPVQLPVRVLSAVTRMGFLPRGSYVAVDVAGRWVRVAAAYGSVFAERPRSGLSLL